MAEPMKASMSDTRSVDIQAMAAWDMWIHPYSLGLPDDVARRIKTQVATEDDLAFIQPFVTRALHQLLDAEVNVPRPS